MNYCPVCGKGTTLHQGKYTCPNCGRVYAERITSWRKRIIINEITPPESATTHVSRKTSVSRGESAEPHDSGEADTEEKGEKKE